MGCGKLFSGDQAAGKAAGFTPGLPHFAPKVKSVIFMHMAGGPSHLELFDYKPELEKLNGLDTPQSLLEGKNFAFIKGTPKLLGPQANFAKAGNSGRSDELRVGKEGGSTCRSRCAPTT